MSPRNWIIVTIAGCAALVALAVSFNVALDIYGLFHDPAGRQLEVYGDDRVAKYLLSERYVPANFDSLLIGSSVSGNWDVSGIHGVHLYNESLNGGYISEEKALLDQVLATSDPRVVLLIVHPYLTSSHEFRTVHLSPKENWGALGSIGLINAYKDLVKVHLGWEKPSTDPNGTESYGSAKKRLNDKLVEFWRPGGDFEVDPIALGLYFDAIGELQARHIPILFIIPPTQQSLLAPKAEAFRKYVAMILAHRSAEDRVLDFSQDEYLDFRKDDSNYSDGVHFVTAGAAKLVPLIDADVRAWGIARQRPR